MEAVEERSGWEKVEAVSAVDCRREGRVGAVEEGAARTC